MSWCICSYMWRTAWTWDERLELEMNSLNLRRALWLWGEQCELEMSSVNLRWVVWMMRHAHIHTTLKLFYFVEAVSLLLLYKCFPLWLQLFLKVSLFSHVLSFLWSSAVWNEVQLIEMKFSWLKWSSADWNEVQLTEWSLADWNEVQLIEMKFSWLKWSSADWNEVKLIEMKFSWLNNSLISYLYIRLFDQVGEITAHVPLTCLLRLILLTSFFSLQVFVCLYGWEDLRYAILLH